MTLEEIIHAYRTLGSLHYQFNHSRALLEGIFVEDIKDILLALFHASVALEEIKKQKEQES